MAACGLMMTFVMAPGIAVGYISALGVMMTLGTLGYDEFEGGYPYLFTLPVTRRTYVREKYVFCLLGAMAGAAFGTILCPAVSALKGEAGAMPFSDLIFTGVVTMCVIFIVMAGIMIPVRLKFGTEKSRIVLFGIFAVITAAAFVIKSSKSAFLEEIAEKLDVFSAKVSGLTVLFAVICVTAVLLIISEQISERILEKKEY